MSPPSGPLSRAFSAFEAGSFAIQEFSAAFRVRDDVKSLKALKDTLESQNKAVLSPYRTVPGLHSLRWLLVDGLEQPPNGATSHPKTPAGPLVFACAHDGDTQDFLYALLGEAHTAIEDVLQHCDAGLTGDPKKDVQRLLAARLPATYFFDDVGAPSSQIHRALALRRRFVNFVAATQHAPEADLLSRFRLEFVETAFPAVPLPPDESSGVSPKLGYPFPLSSFESPIPGEADWIRRAAGLARAKVSRDTREARDKNPAAPARRPVHAKHHGCVRAKFEVRKDLEPRLCRGLFVPGARYDARIRFSNAASPAQHDARPDGRGIAIKLLNVPGRSLLDGPRSNGADGVADFTTQDFLLESSPTFFVPDVQEYFLFRSIFDQRPSLERTFRLAMFGVLHPRDVTPFARAFFRLIMNPIYAEYHSMVAYLLGPQLAVKYSVRPTEWPIGRWLQPVDYCSPDFLRQALKFSLSRSRTRQVSLEFAVHFSETGNLPVEDPRVDWDRHGARRIPVATLVIEPQDFDTDERMKACEDEVYNPWNALPEHRPLGSLSRSRFAVYRASSQKRLELNQRPS